MPFDAQAARALSRRSLGAADILAELKRAVVEASQRGDFSATVKLPDPELVPAGQSTNSASFLIDHLQARGLLAWADALRQAQRAAYGLRPVWRPMGLGAGCDGVTLTWSVVVDEPEGPLQLMSADIAYRMARAARAHHQWVEAALTRVRKSAAQGRISCTVHDPLPAQADAWPRRCELLQQAGFATELIAAEQGADLVIRW